MIGGKYFLYLEDTFFVLEAETQEDSLRMIRQIGALIWIFTFSSEMKKLYIYFIVNIGWHHESIVPDILEMNWNVRDFLLIGKKS